MSSTAEQVAAMNLTWNSSNGSRLIPSIRPSWHNKGNSAAAYGPIFAFPAARLAVGCSSANTSYTCSHSSATPTGVGVEDFLSTSEVDPEGRPKSSLKVYVLMQDMMGQNMTVGEPAHCFSSVVHLGLPLFIPWRQPHLSVFALILC